MPDAPHEPRLAPPVPGGPDVPMKDPDEQPSFFQQARGVKLIIRGLFIACGLLVLVDLFGYDKHAHFSQENWFGFYGFYGFVGCVLLVLAARVLRVLVMRREDYWDE